jgi:transposase-like protein
LATETDLRVKAEAIAAVLGGMSVSAAAEKFGVDRATIRRWRDAQVAHVAQGPTRAREALLDELDSYVLEALKAMRVQMLVATDVQWLRQHTPSDLAVLHRTISECVARIVEAQMVSNDTFRDEPVAIRANR